MRKCAYLVVALLAVLSFSLPSQASAQTLFFGVGPSFPMGDYGDYADPGFIGVAGVDFPIGTSGLGIFGEGFFGKNSHGDHEGDSTNPYGVMGGAIFDFMPDEPGGVYAFAGAGLMVHKYNSDEFEGDSESALALEAGAGYAFPLAGVEAFVEGRLMTASYDYDSEFEDAGSEATRFIGIVAGVAIPVGGGGG